MPKISDGFDYPVGHADSYGLISATEVWGDSDGYNNAQDFGVPNTDRGGKLHLGEDWNDDGGGNSDLGDSVYAVSNGTVRFAGDAGNGWGNVIIIEHTLPSGEYGGTVTSAYEHLESIAASIAPGVDVDRGDVIGGIGKTGGQQYAHLHFEMRSDESLGAKVPGYAATTDGWIDPSDFIDAHRPRVIVGSPGDDVLIGDANDEIIHGGTGNDKLFGSEGNDILSGGWGFDLLDGGEGEDTADYSFYIPSDGLKIDLGTGEVSFRPEHSSLSGEVEKLVSIENVIGGGGSDTLIGSVGNNTLSGGSGNDTLNGGEGNDVLNGGPDSDPINVDTLTGGPGKDQFWASTGSDVITDFNPDEDSLWLPEDTEGRFNAWANTTILTYLNGTIALENVDLGPHVAANDYPWLEWHDDMPLIA